MAYVLDKKTGDIGLGLMRLTLVDNPKPHDVAFGAMKRSLADPANATVCWNGGQIYGTNDANSLHLLNAYFTKYPEDAKKVILCIKGALDHTYKPDASREGIKRSVDRCLEVLDGKKFLDLFECARVDKTVPIEETMEALGEYVKAGKIGGISLSEVGPETIKKASAVQKISAVEVEFSMFRPGILTNGVGKICGELDIPIFGYSPLSRGFLTGAIKSQSDVDDMRKRFPLFAPEHFDENMKLVNRVEDVAKKHGCTSGQIALSWCLWHSGRDGMPTIIPIPGGSTEAQVLENTKHVKLSDNDMREIDELVKTIEVKGARYPEMFAHLEAP